MQFFKEEPDYFLEKRYADFDQSLEKAIGELQAARKRIGLEKRPTLTDLEMVHVAIAYNTGHFNPAKGLKQGFKSDDGKFYGEQVFAFMQTAKTVSAEDETTTPPAAGARFKVAASALNLRSEPLIDQSNPKTNVTAKLPNGHIVRAITNQAVNGFLEVETEFEGKHLSGFASAQFLTPV